MTAAEAAYSTGSASETRSVEHGKRVGSSRTFDITDQGALGVLPGFKQEACKVRWQQDNALGERRSREAWPPWAACGERRFTSHAAERRARRSKHRDRNAVTARCLPTLHGVERWTSPTTQDVARNLASSKFRDTSGGSRIDERVKPARAVVVVGAAATA